MLPYNIEKLLRQRYYLNNTENWDGLVNRVVNHVCQGEQADYKNEMKNILFNRIFLPNSPCLVNSGKATNGLFACFVVGPTEDTLEDHFETLKEIAFVAKRGGGCGFTGTHIRPANSPVAGSTHGYSYGPNRFAANVSSCMDMMTQSGFRRMALMYTLDVEHLDIADFVDLKQSGDEDSLYNFNQSVMASDDWMRKALIKGTPESVLFEKIAYNAWNNGEPGLIFSDTVNNNSPYRHSFQRIYATNPCAEQALPPYGSCNLGSINVNHNYFYDNNNNFLFDKFVHIVHQTIQFLDNVGVVNTFPTEKFENWYENNRPVGLGMMGIADAFLRMGITYGDTDSIEFLEELSEIMCEGAYDKSEQLGRERGIPKSNIHVGKETGHYRRNATCISYAPTGSIAMIADCSHVVEPIFSESFMRTDERGETYLFEHPLRNESFFVSAIGANQPTWKQQIDLVNAVQTNCDSGVSKTINLPNSATVEDVKAAMVYAWKSNCKGITLYRDGSREFQVLTTVKEEDKALQMCKDGVCTI